jgi:hypothetical protein
VGKKLIDDLLELRVQIHIGLRDDWNRRFGKARILANGIHDEKSRKNLSDSFITRRRNFRASMKVDRPTQYLQESGAWRR